MRSATHLLILIFTLFTASCYAANATKQQPNTTKQQPDLSVVLDGELLATKARVIGNNVYVDVKDIGEALNWNVQNSGSTVVIKTSRATAQSNAKISGTITYFFNSNYGNKPDTGATVSLIQYDPNFRLQTENVFILFTKDRLVSENVFRLEQLPLFMLFPSLDSMKNNPKEMTFFPIVSSSAVDGSGRYEINGIKPGKYILIIVSSHAMGNSALHRMGKVFSTNIEAESGESRDVSHDFGMTEW